MSDLGFWLLVFGGIALVLVAVAVGLEWIGRRDRQRLAEERANDSPWSLRSRRDQELDAITRGKDPRR